ncbi:hypothetical protein J8273_2869 [Carpediemonas membranifera]|uniref:Uncharacterized protein n=1 Tax=Carpediemonas membranifera TaxID=201153 RepID=A0A8J6EAX8_9EUKA|nr:hypothetical protein J8273_2869 [Carpediemonas membranifera]|eukprot:KAG9395665.1 hypothetical protein J8273_2869 [Carpediemonas membranifera]
MNVPLALAIGFIVLIGVELAIFLVMAASCQASLLVLVSLILARRISARKEKRRAAKHNAMSASPPPSIQTGLVMDEVPTFVQQTVPAKAAASSHGDSSSDALLDADDSDALCSASSSSENDSPTITITYDSHPSPATPQIDPRNLVPPTSMRKQPAGRRAKSLKTEARPGPVRTSPQREAPPASLTSPTSPPGMNLVRQQSFGGFNIADWGR